MVQRMIKDGELVVKGGLVHGPWLFIKLPNVAPGSRVQVCTVCTVCTSRGKGPMCREGMPLEIVTNGCRNDISECLRCSKYINQDS
eukprot:1146448-Pelagomonas_calceolata.AAC.1